MKWLQTIAYDSGYQDGFEKGRDAAASHRELMTNHYWDIVMAKCKKELQVDIDKLNADILDFEKNRDAYVLKSLKDLNIVASISLPQLKVH